MNRSLVDAAVYASYTKDIIIYLCVEGLVEAFYG